MYDNIGGKIKGLAKATFIVEAIAAFITGIVLMAVDEDLILYGALTMICGPIVAWVSSWLLYGFGEIIDKLVEIERNTAKSSKPKKSRAKDNAQEKKKEEITETEDHCVRVECSTCQEELYFDADATSGECPYCGAYIDLGK